MSSGGSISAFLDQPFLVGGLDSFKAGGSVFVIGILQPRKVNLFVIPSVGRVISLKIRSSSGEGK